MKADSSHRTIVIGVCVLLLFVFGIYVYEKNSNTDLEPVDNSNTNDSITETSNFNDPELIFDTQCDEDGECTIIQTTTQEQKLDKCLEGVNETIREVSTQNLTVDESKIILEYRQNEIENCHKRYPIN